MQPIMVDDTARDSNCIVCCCDTVSIKPGETLPLTLNYAGWAVPIAPRGLHCEPTVEVEEKDTCDTPVIIGNQPPLITAPPIIIATAINTPVDVTLGNLITDPDADPITYKRMGLYGPYYGTIAKVAAAQQAILPKPHTPPGAPAPHLPADFTYTPSPNFVGVDRLFATASDGINSPTPFEMMFAVGVPTSSAISTPDLAIGQPTINQRYYTVMIPIVASPLARPCQVFRLTVRQGALDCDCNCYYRTDCVDVRIAKC